MDFESPNLSQTIYFKDFYSTALKKTTASNPLLDPFWIFCFPPALSGLQPNVLSCSALGSSCCNTRQEADSFRAFGRDKATHTALQRPPRETEPI